MSLGAIPAGAAAEILHCTRTDGAETEEMGILHICADLKSAGDQTLLLEEYLGKAGFDVRRLPCRDAETWDGVLDANEIDIVAIGDYPGDAAALARKTVRRNPLIGILLYGPRNAGAEAPAGRSPHAAVRTHPDAKYAEPAISMVRAHRYKWNDMIFLRGVLISQIVEVESHINDALAAHFRVEPSRAAQFEDLILENPLFSLEGKKQALKRIAQNLDIQEWRGMDAAMSDLQSNRNKLAHCEVDPGDPNRITSMHKQYHYDRDRMRALIKKARLARQRLSAITQILEGRDGGGGPPPATS